MRSFLFRAGSVTLSLGLTINPFLALAQTATPTTSSVAPTTPIQHVVIIYGENESFDHYFGTYPKATNPPGQPRFTALPGTPSANNYETNPTLLTANPNLNSANGSGAANPFRLNRTQALTPSQSHSYTPEQNSFDQGAMDLFPSKTGSAGSSSSMSVLTPAVVTTKGIVMGYYDGNTVTALWNYAQNFALSDNSYNSNFGPSSPGAINLISGQTNGIIATLNGPSTNEINDGQGGMTLIGDADPLMDVCSSNTGFQVQMTGTNVGDLLNTAGLTWGWFQGGFDLTVTNPNGTTGCHRSTVSPITGLTEADYVQHHEPFQFYATTRNPSHTRPASVANIGFSDGANHQYDIHDFFDSLSAGNLAAVSFLKAPSYQNAHPGNSNPLDEQAFVVNVVNTLEKSSFWNSTAIIIAYDDSDGWYDHRQGPIINGSFSTSDTISGANACGTQGTTPQLPGPNSGVNPVNGRCSPGVRTPLLVISPWAKANYIDDTFTIQTSITRFIENNWNLGQVGGGSYDALPGTTVNGAFVGDLSTMFNFSNPNGPPPNTNAPILSPVTGLP
jgi:phospholipase C